MQSYDDYFKPLLNNLLYDSFRQRVFYASRAGPAHYAEPRLSSFLYFFRPQIYVFLHYAILGGMENMGKSYANVCKTIVSTL